MKGYSMVKKKCTLCHYCDGYVSPDFIHDVLDKTPLSDGSDIHSAQAVVCPWIGEPFCNCGVIVSLLSHSPK